MCFSTDERKPCARYLYHERRERQSLLVIVDCKVSQSQLMEATAQIVEGFLARATYAEVSIKEGEALRKRKGWLSMFTLEHCPPKCGTLKKSRHVRVWLDTTSVPLMQGIMHQTRGTSQN